MHRVIAVSAVVALAGTAVFATLATSAPDRPTGKLVFVSDRADGQRELYAVNEDGSGERRVTFNDIFERQAAWSPDGTRIAFSGLRDGNWDIYTVAADGDLRRLTTDPARDDYPRWTSDGHVVFTRGLFDCPCVEWIADADGTNVQQLPLKGDVTSADPSPRGGRIVYASRDGSVSSIRVAQLDGKADKQLTTPPSGAIDFEPRFAPNGKDIVFLRDPNGVDNDIWLVRRDGTGLRQLTNTPDRAEFWPTFSSDGSEVLFQANRHLFGISLATGAERAVSTWPRAPLSDDFADGVRDASLWHEIADPGGTVAETGGRLVLSISGTATPGGQFNQVDEHIGSQCALTGDYDYQAAYELLTWPHLGGFRAQLSAYFGDASIGRASVAVPWAPSWNDEQYFGFATGGNGAFATTDQAGSVRLVRKDGIVTGYVQTGTGWRPVYSGSATGDTVYGLGLFSQAADFGHKDGSVAFDDFRLTSGALRCPDWWGDAAPDAWGPQPGGGDDSD
jgi:dipeptidyl aminopeptidase/acylaminoacyl peptidase